MGDEHLKRIQSQVDDMNKVFMPEAEGDVKTDPPSTDPPEEMKTDPPSTDPPEGDETDPPKTDAPKTDPPKTDPPSTDPPEDKDKIIEKLREKLAKGDETEPPKTKAPKTQPPTTDAPPQDIDFVGELDLENLSENKEEANKLFNKIYQEAIKSRGESSAPDVMAAIPSLVVAISSLQEVTKTFYKENPDLVPYMKVVGTTFEDLAEKNPDKKYEDLINDVAPIVRQKLELPAPKKAAKKTPPRLPRKKAKAGKVRDDDELPSVESQIDEMNKTLGR